MITDSSYVPLHLRSNYSLMTGTARIEEILERVGRLGFRSVALTDTNNLYGAIPFYTQARQLGIKPILGAEIVHPSGRAVLLARNLAGYANLCRVITRRNLEEKLVLSETLARFQEGLFVLVEDPELARALAGTIDRGSLRLELVLQGRSETHRRRLLDCAGELGIDVVAGGDVYFLDPSDHELHRMLTAMRLNRLVSQLAPGEVVSPDSYLASSEEMSRRFADFPDALANTRRIAEMCELEIPTGKPIFPRCPLPPGQTAYSHLYKLCLEGLAWRYKPISQAAVERLTYELSIIDRLGFSEYFVIVGDIVRYARSRGIPTVGRGSGASAIVAYLLGITNADPLRFGLPFERFLNPGRLDCPDLDIDLCWRLRDDVIHYVYQRYGADHVAMISTHNCLRRRSAFREMAKACGISNDVVNRIARRVPYHGEVPPVEELAASFPDIVLDSALLTRILHWANRVDGFPHHLSIHCGGIVISDRTIDSYVPLEEAAKGIAITQYEMNAIETIGLVKIDLLGNRALSTVRQTVELIREGEGTRIDPDALPDADPETLSLIRNGRTLGCCQLESPAMRHLLLMLKPERIERLVQALALIRPAPASVGMKEVFVRRARGLEPPRFPHPSLERVLGDTFGIMLYEDDAMLVASTLSGLSLEEGDRLRKAIKKCRTREELVKLSRYFIDCSVRNGVPAEVAADVWTQMAKFNEYSFCRAHAAGYGLVAYQGAYLKAHHPAAYMTAALNNVQGIYPRRVHVWEARRMGVEVLPPCVNRSEVEFTLESGKIRMGLGQVKGLSAQVMEGILAQRPKAPFRSVRDFLGRVRVSGPELESLILVGGFDFTGRIRPELIWQARMLFGRVRKGAASSTFYSEEETLQPPALTDYTVEQKVNYEFEILECPLSAHPIELVKRSGADGTVRCADLPALLGRNVRLLGILDTNRGAPTRSGELMQFVTMEDETGVFEVTLFPRSWQQYRRVLYDAGPYRVEGKVESQYDSLSVTARRISRVLCTT